MVSDTWFAAQLALQADAVCGTVSVLDWPPHGCNAALIKAHFEETYFDVESHRHVHGANLDVSATAYRRVGGFKHWACSEDVDLVSSLVDAGCNVAWSSQPRVVTSARADAQTPPGFAGALLNAVAQPLAEPALMSSQAAAVGA